MRVTPREKRASVNNSRPAPRKKVSGPRALPSDSAVLAEISAKLDRVVAVLAAQGKERDRQIEILTAAGCDSAFVGAVVGMSASAVRMAQTRARRRQQPSPESPPDDEAA